MFICLFDKSILNPLSVQLTQRFSTLSHQSSSSQNANKLVDNLLGCRRCISANRSLVFNDNKKGSGVNDSTDKTKVKVTAQDDRPVEGKLLDPKLALASS